MVLLRLLLRDLLSTDVVLDVLGVAAVLTGALRLSARFHDDPAVDDRPRVRSRVVLGSLEIALGTVSILEHGPTRLTAIAVGLWGLVAGAILLQEALAMRRRPRPSG